MAIGADLTDALTVDPGVCGEVMLRTYIDDSGSDPNSNDFVLGGIMAETAAWGRIEGKWDRLLHKWRVRQFKMSEAVNRRGAFRGWSEDAIRKCVQQFAIVIGQELTIPFALHIRPSDIEEAYGPAKTRRTPYPLLVLGAIVMSDKFADAYKTIRERESGRFSCVFDRQNGHMKDVKLVNRLLPKKCVGFTHAPSDVLYGLQAADMWAWTIRSKITKRGEDLGAFELLTGGAFDPSRGLASFSAHHLRFLQAAIRTQWQKAYRRS